MEKPKMTKRILCVLLSLIIFTATFAGLELTVSAGTNGHTQAEAVAWVNSQVGSFHGNGQCVYFVRDYYAYLGQSMPGGSANQYANGGQYCPSGWSYKSSPQPGDIAVWTGGINGHVAVVTEIRGSQMVCVESNYSNNLNVSANLHNIDAYTYIRPDFAANPEGYVDSIMGKPGAVNVTGWCFDRDDPTQSLRVHVYIGGPAGSGAEGHEIMANVSRGDVDNAFHVGQYHGFDSTISTSRTGQQEVYIYAINIGSGYNVEIGHGTANIPGSEMTSGYARTIPDGDYVIASALGRFYLDIYGTELPAAPERMIDICEKGGQWTNIAACEVWTLKYNSDGFYSIYQRGTNVSLDVTNATIYAKAKLQTCNANNSSAQKFAISKLDNGNYRIQAKCSGFSLDVYERQAVTGTPVIQDEWHGGSNQQWYFIPYKPSVSSSDKVATTAYGGHEYTLYKKLMTWNDARDWCRDQGGNLVTITSSGEQSAVESLMAKASNWIWLGATDEASEGVWKWVTGESFSYSNWASGQPDNSGNEDYLHMYLDGKWNDIPDYDGRCEYFILEKDHAHISDSGTVTTAPTCTQTGEKTYKCTACGATIKTETISALGHNYQLEERIEPTCTEKGQQTDICERCGDVKTTTISKLGHTLRDDGVYSVEGNYTYYTQTCSRCEEKVSRRTNDFYNKQLGWVSGELPNITVDKSVSPTFETSFIVSISLSTVSPLYSFQITPSLPISFVFPGNTSGGQVYMHGDLSQASTGEYRVKLEVESAMVWTGGNLIVPISGEAVSTITVTCSHSGVTSSDCVDGKCPYCGEKMEFTPEEPDAVPISIYLDSKPTRKNYEAGESFDPAGAKLRVKYSDGSIKDLTTSDVQVVGYDNTGSGVQKLHFEYTENGVTLSTWTFSVVVDKQLSNIWVTKKPTKTDYVMGEQFDRTGMEVVATFTDGTKADITNKISTSGFDGSSSGTKKMTVSYTYKGVTKTTQFSYIMRPKLDYIKITQKPYKLASYKVGDSFQRDGLIVTAYFTDGSSKEVTNIKTSGFSSKTVGKQIITVSYTYATQTRSAQFSIIMNE